MNNQGTTRDSGRFIAMTNSSKDVAILHPHLLMTKSKVEKSLDEIKSAVHGNILNIILLFGLGIPILRFNFDGSITSSIIISIIWKIPIGICLLATPLNTIGSK